jgi:hypothetical protein
MDSIQYGKVTISNGNDEGGILSKYYEIIHHGRENSTCQTVSPSSVVLLL